MKVKFFIRKEINKKDIDNKAKIYVRLYHCHIVDQTTRTGLFINPIFWDAKRESGKTIGVPESIWRPLNEELRKIRSFLEDKYIEKNGGKFNSNWLNETIKAYYTPVKSKEKELDFFDVFNLYLRIHDISDVRRKNYQVLKRSLQRYELYKRLGKNKAYKLRLKEINSDTIVDFKEFFRDEYIYFEKYPELFLSVPESRPPHKRGRNTLIDRLNRLHAFFEWCYKNKYIDSQPFDNVEIGACNYGRPIYITLQERNQIMNYDLSLRPQLAIQRDIFIFQSLIGCRVSDLYRLTKNNIQDDAIEYIPHKTKNGHPITVHVPLNKHAKALLEKYNSDDRDTLFPFISVQKYNDAIKEVFKVCGIDRIVVLLDPLTNEEVQKPIYEVASSHMARRTFIGNLYKQVKDQNLISSLSGHREGSKAFARYRDIDNEIKKELVNLLN